MTRHAIWLITTLFIAALASASPAAAAMCDTSWNSAVSGNWNDAVRWTPTVPNAGINACITVAGNYTVTVTGSGAIAAGLTLGGSSGTQTLRLAANGSSHVKLTLQNQGADSSAGILANGVLALDTDFAAFNIKLDVAGGTLTNAGTIQALTGAGGAGQRNLSGNLNNQGTLTVNETLRDDSAAADVWTTSGTITIANDMSLILSGTGKSFTQTAGTITNNGSFSLSGGSFTAAGGTATGNGLDLVDVTVNPSGTGSGVFNIRSTANVLGSDVGSGYTLRIASNGVAHARLDVNVNRTNNGTLVLSTDHNAFNTKLNIAGGTLTNAGTIQVLTGAGNGGLRNIAGVISNPGTIDLDESVVLDSGSWSNTGTIDVASGKTLLIVFGTSVSQSGAGSTTGTGAIQVNGTLSGIGSIAPAVTNNGVVAPGASPGILSLGGTYVQTGSGQLKIEIFGLTPGTQYDRLAVSGTASLAGSLVVSTGVATTIGQTFTILTASSVSGTFGTVSAGGYTVRYNAADVTLEVSGPTAVRALSFAARRDQAGALLRWRMGSERGLLGYVLYRNGVRLNRSLVAAGRMSYSFRDRTPGLRPRYTLYAVGLDGKRVLIARTSAAS